MQNPWSQLTAKERAVLERLSTAIKIQNHLDHLPMNHEKRGETHMSPRRVIREKKAHCFEGALLAAAALWYHGQKPLLMDLTARRPDDDHIVTLYKMNGYWGAISKTNHPGLRFRDPVYKTVRELAVSYFHEWFFYADGEKTLESFSTPLNLKTFGAEWITAENDLWHFDKRLNELPHFRIYPRANKRYIRNATPIERKAASTEEWLESNPRT